MLALLKILALMINKQTETNRISNTAKISRKQYNELKEKIACDVVA